MMSIISSWGEHGSHGDLLLEVVPGKVDLVSDRSSIELNLHDVSLLLSAPQDLHLGVDENTDDSAVLLHLSQVLLDLLLAEIISPLGAGLGEGFLLGLRPVLVEPPLGLLSNMLSPDSLQGPHTTGGLNVTHDSNAHDRRSLDDGDGLDHLLLVDLGAGSVDLPDDVGHTGLVAHEGSQVDRLGRIILWEGLNLAAVSLGPLFREESLRTVTRSLELPVRHLSSLVEVNQAILA